MDEYSKFPVVFEVPTTAADHVLPKLEDLFSFIGIPMELKSDNGPPFREEIKVLPLEDWLEDD